MDGTQLAQFRATVERQLKERAWSGRTLALKAGLNPGTISKFLRGVGPRPEAQTILGIASALDLVVGGPVSETAAGAPTPTANVPSTRGPAGRDYANGYRDGWRDGWDAAVAVLSGVRSGSTPSTP